MGKGSQAQTPVLFVGINVMGQKDLKYPVGEKTGKTHRQSGHAPKVPCLDSGEAALLIPGYLKPESEKVQTALF